MNYNLDKQIRLNLKFLVNGPLFHGIDSHYIFNKFYNLFLETKVKNLEKIINFDDYNNCIIIVKHGEFKLSIRMNLSEIDKLIVNLDPKFEKVVKKKFMYGKLIFIHRK